MGVTAGLMVDQIDPLTPSEVWLQIDGHEEREKAEWERTRALCFNIHIHSMMEGKKKTMSSFWPFPWDEETDKVDGKAIIASHARRKAIREALEKKKQ